MIMKKLYALVVCLLLCVSLPARAESYVLDDAGEREFSTISSTEYDINGEAGVLTFEGKYSTIMRVGSSSNCYLDQYVDGAWIRVADAGYAHPGLAVVDLYARPSGYQNKDVYRDGSCRQQTLPQCKGNARAIYRGRKHQSFQLHLGLGCRRCKDPAFLAALFQRCRTPHRFVEQSRLYGIDRSDGYRAGRYDGRCLPLLMPLPIWARHDATITVTDGIVSFTQAVVGLCAPTNIEAGEATFHKLPVTWSPVSGAESYTIQMRNALNEVEAEETVSTPGYTMTGLTPDAAYSVRVCANYPGGLSSGFASGLVKTDSYIPAPQDFTVETIFESTPVSASWSTVDDVVTYSVRFYTADGNMAAEVTDLTGSSASLDVDLDPTLSYEARLRHRL